MNNRELNEYIQRSKNHLEEILANKESLRKFLHEAGILDKNGNLSKRYQHNTSSKSI